MSVCLMNFCELSSKYCKTWNNQIKGGKIPARSVSLLSLKLTAVNIKVSVPKSAAKFSVQIFI